MRVSLRETYLGHRGLGLCGGLSPTSECLEKFRFHKKKSAGEVEVYLS